MKASSKFDYIIVGGGLSGLHLSYCFLNDKYFNDYSFLIIDKEKSKKEDNFFSFWETGNGKWDKILKELRGNNLIDIFKSEDEKLFIKSV